VSDVVVTRLIAASPATVFSFFTEIERWTAWQGVGGELEPRRDGLLRIQMPGGQVASGRILEVVPDRRLVFTWGWEGDGAPLPPGASTVVIELEPEGGGTRLRLTHSGLAAPPLAEHHRQGWERYLDRLLRRAEGEDPGPDLPFVEAGPARA
jgi:uncharacterized protein YndB with AHSA1/START domain